MSPELGDFSRDLAASDAPRADVARGRDETTDPSVGAGPDAQRAPGRAVRASGVAAVDPILNLDSTLHNSHTTPHPQGDLPDFGECMDGKWYGKITAMGHRAELLLVEDEDRSLGRVRGRKGERPGEISEQRLEEAVNGLASGLEPDLVDAATVEQRRLMSVLRAKRNCTWKIIAIKADRMLTLTQRGRIATRDAAQRYAADFVRRVKRWYPQFICVYVIEAHKIDGFHVHMAINRFYHLDRLRLAWHRVLTGRPLTAILRGEDSPGNIQLGEVRRSQKMVRYMTKYITKTFADEVAPGSRRFFASEQILLPIPKVFRMPTLCGAEVYQARCMLERRGFRVVKLFETIISGRRAIWMRGERVAGAVDCII